MYNRLGTSMKRRFAKQMRDNPTPPEALMWEVLDSNRTGYRFHRQVVLRGYIADFYCPELKLIIEVDGSQHNATYDRRRDKHLARLGAKTIRIKAKTVFTGSPETLTKLVRQRIRQTRPEIKEAEKAEFREFMLRSLGSNE
jgi:very-short-patch-repair endonuclease